MKTIAIKCLLILAGLLIISCTMLAMGYSYMLLRYVNSHLTTILTSILYTIPLILSFLLVILSTGTPIVGIILIIKGCAYRGKR